MSKAPMPSARTLKILAIPLARLGPAATTRPLVYFHTSLPSLPSNSKLSLSDDNTHDPRSDLRSKIEAKLGLKPNAPLMLQLTTKATDLWVGLGEKKEGSWQVKAHRYGERLMDRIEYEEWSLKTLERGSVPPALLDLPEVESKMGDNQLKSQTGKSDQVIPVLYPGKQFSDPVSELTAFVDQRIPYHDRYFKRTLILIPFSTIFGIIPVIPNFVFFFVAWRTWSHWKARNAAQIIKSLISSDRIVAEESSSLSKIYSECSSEDSKSQDRQGDDRGAMLLTKEAVDKIVTSQGLGSVGKEELLRALGQATLRLESHRKTQTSDPDAEKKIHPTNLDPTTSPTEEIGGKKGK